MRLHKKIEDRVAKGIVLVADDHVRGIGDVAVVGMGDERAEVRDGLGRDKIARSPTNQVDRKRKPRGGDAQFAASIIATVPTFDLAAHDAVDESRIQCQ